MSDVIKALLHPTWEVSISYVLAVNRRLHYWRFDSAHFDEKDLIKKHCEYGDTPEYAATMIGNQRVTRWRGGAV